MARYTGADCRRCRREKMKLFLKGSKCESPKCPLEQRPYPPGEHGRGRIREPEYMWQPPEKQKARRLSGAPVVGVVLGLGAATPTLTAARPQGVAAGMRFTLAVAAVLILVALAIAVGSRALSRHMAGEALKTPPPTRLGVWRPSRNPTF